MNSQQLLYINIILGVLFVLYFLLGKGKGRQPTKLNVKANEDFTKSLIKTRDVTEPSAKTSLNSQIEGKASEESQLGMKSFTKSQEKMTVLEPENVVSLKDFKTKNLSTYFMYNGHEWESHEVLGIPQGAQMSVVTEAYQKIIRHSDPSSFEFYEAAYQAILKKWRDRL